MNLIKIEQKKIQYSINFIFSSLLRLIELFNHALHCAFANGYFNLIWQLIEYIIQLLCYLTLGIGNKSS